VLYDSDQRRRRKNGRKIIITWHRDLRPHGEAIGGTAKDKAKIFSRSASSPDVRLNLPKLEKIIGERFTGKTPAS